MRNAVPDGLSVAARAVDRALAERHAAYTREVRLLVDAGIAVMRATESTDPPVSAIVRHAGLSNQAFYRHFRSKDELLVAVLDEGLRQLVAYVEDRMAGAGSVPDQVRRWIEAVMAQAGNPRAADATRPFALDRRRLAEAFPEEVARAIDRIEEPLRRAIATGKEVGAFPNADARRDAHLLCQLVMGQMQDWLAARTEPARTDLNHVVEFCLGALTRKDRQPWNVS